MNKNRSPFFRTWILSALFLLVAKAVEDKLADELKGTEATVLQTSLSNEQEAKLRELFAADEIEA